MPLKTRGTGIISTSLIKYVNNTCTARHQGTVEKNPYRALPACFEMY